jgi:hypothetical protein
MTTTAQYASVPKSAVPQLTAANTARDGTGTLVTVFSAAAGGSPGLARGHRTDWGDGLGQRPLAASVRWRLKRLRQVTKFS